MNGVGVRKNLEVCPLDRMPCSLIVWFLEVSFFDRVLTLFARTGWAKVRGGRRTLVFGRVARLGTKPSGSVLAERLSGNGFKDK